jgi:hypothetical protein
LRNSKPNDEIRNNFNGNQNGAETRLLGIMKIANLML